MFKLYNEISALGKFSRGMCTEYIDFVDSMCWFEYDFGVGYVCPEKTDYWFGHCLDLYHVREDVTGEKLAVMWGQYLAPHAAKAVKKVVRWESERFINYPNIDKKYGLQCELILKHVADSAKIERPQFNVRPIIAADFRQMVDIYVDDAGEAQREFIQWSTKSRLDAIAAKQANFFAIWNVDRDEIAAIAGIYWQGGIYRYASVTTRKAYRGRGYASALIAHIRDYALDKGADEIYIIAENGSQAAKIYGDAGFEIASHLYSLVAARD
ncbi:MAG: GNAT family N-acetyltransferase [Rhizobiales bacterium]|nr:GNAT family N-acetyltransferase [Hyphomicrobiales bacterium]NRB13867.1 GNAT family N-acetyltransferase [Hyphomicrobiales bacterium]